MTKYILDYIKNNTKTVFLGMSKTQKQTMKVMVKRMFKVQSGILRKLGDGKQKELPKTMAQKFSRELGKIDLLNPVEEYADRRIVENMENGGVVAYDLTDIAKENSAKIEKITPIFDGSQRKVSRGFFVHGVGVGRCLWRLRLHDNDAKFLPQVRKQILAKLIPLTKSKKPIFVFDRGNDDRKLFEYLTDQNTRFIVRLKKNREVVMKESGEVRKIADIAPGRYKILIKENATKHLKKPEFCEYELVVHQKQKSKKQPIRLIISRDFEQTTKTSQKLSNKKIVNLYLQRWGVENSFKQIKTSLNLEKIRVMKFKKFQNLVSLMHFCSLLNEILLTKLRENIKIFQNIHLTKLFYNFKKFLKRYSLYSNSHSFLKFLQKIFPTFFVHRKRRLRYTQYSLFSFNVENVRTF